MKKILKVVLASIIIGFIVGIKNLLEFFKLLSTCDHKQGKWIMPDGVCWYCGKFVGKKGNKKYY